MAIITPIILLLKNSKSVRNALTPGLVSSFILSSLFLVVRKFQPICNHLPSETRDGCKFDWREAEIFTFFLCFMVLKNRQAVSLEQVITTTLMYSKLASMVLFYRLNPLAGFVYALLCLVRVWLFPENFVEGPEEITYFSDKTLEEALQEDSRVVWIVEFYATWSPPCRAVMPAFAAISNEYATDFLRFGKVDIGKYPEAAKKYGVSPSTMSKQLPTVIVFEDGKAVNWRPMIGDKKRFIKYVFSEDNMKRDFDLNKLYEESLNKCKKFNKSKKVD